MSKEKVFIINILERALYSKKHSDSAWETMGWTFDEMIFMSMRELKSYYNKINFLIINKHGISRSGLEQ